MKNQEKNGNLQVSNQYNIQWFPGHMARTLRVMEQEIQHVDASLILLDARIPLSSLNPEIERITARKPRLYALNKADLADPAVTEEWIRYFRAADAGCVAINAKSKGGTAAVRAAIEKELSGLLARRQARGMSGAKTQVMLCGIPNVGKSTFINALAGKACAKTGNKPGVTKGKQWIRLNKNVERLDTPGILWPKFEDQSVGMKLAFIGSIKDEILQRTELAAEFVKFMQQNYPGVLAEKYSVEEDGDAYGILEGIARSRHCLVRGSELDMEKASTLLLDDFRDGRLGRLTLEYPDQI